MPVKRAGASCLQCGSENKLNMQFLMGITYCWLLSHKQQRRNLQTQLKKSTVSVARLTEPVKATCCPCFHTFSKYYIITIFLGQVYSDPKPIDKTLSYIVKSIWDKYIHVYTDPEPIKLGFRVRVYMYIHCPKYF